MDKQGLAIALVEQYLLLFAWVLNVAVIALMLYTWVLRRDLLKPMQIPTHPNTGLLKPM